jgi:hypothetical protein
MDTLVSVIALLGAVVVGFLLGQNYSKPPIELVILMLQERADWYHQQAQEAQQLVDDTDDDISDIFESSEETIFTSKAAIKFHQKSVYIQNIIRLLKGEEIVLDFGW